MNFVGRARQLSRCVKSVRFKLIRRTFRSSVALRFKPAPIPNGTADLSEIPIAAFTQKELRSILQNARSTRKITKVKKKMKLRWRILRWYIILTILCSLLLFDYYYNYFQYVNTGEDDLLYAIQDIAVFHIFPSLAERPEFKEYYAGYDLDQGKWRYRRINLDITPSTKGEPATEIKCKMMAFNTTIMRAPFVIDLKFSANRIPCFNCTWRLPPEYQEYILTVKQAKLFVGIWVDVLPELPLLPKQFKSREHAEHFAEYNFRSSFRRRVFWWPWYSTN